MAGFECSTQRRRDGRQLDLIASTGHDVHAAADYRACAAAGLRTARDGLRWHLIARADGSFDWSSWLPTLRAARDAGVQVIWDLHHYGHPAHLKFGTPAYTDAFARFAREAARIHVEEVGAPPLVCPVNEISFAAWAAKEGYFPKLITEGRRTKVALVESALAALAAAREVAPDLVAITAEPLISVVPAGPDAHDAATREYGYQWEALDMLSGRTHPELGGHPDAIQVAGLNFYPHNQWFIGKDGRNAGTIPMGHHLYRPLSHLLADAAQRVRLPLLVAETGAEGSARPAWLHYVCDEVRAARAAGTDVRGICLYPVTDYPGWDNDRPCETGLWSAPGPDGARRAYGPLMDELHRQQALFA